ncbi:MAG: hypothetical protein WD595_06620 [Waddliaceae bacterium]
MREKILAAYTQLATERKKARKQIADNFKHIAEDEYLELSYWLDQTEIQESTDVRNVLKARRLVNVLISDDGKIDLASLPHVIELLRLHAHSLGPNRQFDSVRNQHMIQALTSLSSEKPLQQALSKISKPHMNVRGDHLIRATLNLSANVSVTDAHARRAALSAWLCYLRQSVGSCFATAPAIIVQSEQPLKLLSDFQEMLSTGRLKRTFSGVEYAVPLSPSFGAGDLRRLFLMPNASSDQFEAILKQPGLLAALENKESIRLGCVVTDEIYYTTAERIIRRSLLQQLKLSEEELKEYEERPKQMMQNSFLVYPRGGGEGGVGKKSQMFYQRFTEAKERFVTLADNALLKAWEFTLASFSETKLQFAKWNLYTSLGLQPSEAGGIGEKLIEILKSKLDQANEQMQKYQDEYEMLYQQVSFLQRRAKSATTEEEARWRRAEYQSRANEFRTIEELRNKAHVKAHKYANLFNQLIDLYDELFPVYFQEIYDADMHEAKLQFYDDSPAGFRLLYKHGRAKTDVWSLIHGPGEFIQSLSNFFIATESEIAGSAEMSGLEDDVSEIVTLIVNHIRSEEFLETAFHRIAKSHQKQAVKDPLQHLDEIATKPWAYPSGGAMNTLVSCYWRSQEPPKEVSRWVENPVELMVFIIDTVKEMPPSTQQQFIDNRDKSLLAHSPTHAFLIKPGWFDQAWKSTQFTYTWVRDQLVVPAEIFVSKIFLDDEKMRYVIEKLKKRLPEPFVPFFQYAFQDTYGSMNLQVFRDFILDTIDQSQGLNIKGRAVISSETVDEVLFSLMPLFPGYQLEERVTNILSQIDPDLALKAVPHLDAFSATGLISSSELKEICHVLIGLATKQTSVSVNYPEKISMIARKEGYAVPVPFMFADTNWPKDNFAFLVNPGSGKLSLWRVDPTGSVGAPMKMWDPYLNGQIKSPDWGVYIEPHQWVDEQPSFRFL